LENKEMGELAVKHVGLIEQYGILGVRYQTLREFYSCVARTVNEGKSPKVCVQ
jgi:hypothetical protein